jgi:hypothetical protein
MWRRRVSYVEGVVFHERDLLGGGEAAEACALLRDLGERAVAYDQATGVCLRMVGHRQPAVRAAALRALARVAARAGWLPTAGRVAIAAAVRDADAEVRAAALAALDALPSA